VCVSCHGVDGNLIADHRLSRIAQRRDEASIEAAIKNPKPPMPKLYPELLNEQAVEDLTAYLHGELGR
jgi:mono/diheme cytochrome c family protein